MENNQKIKTFISSECPHCKKNIFISAFASLPDFEKIITDDDIMAAKLEFKKKLEELGLKEDRKKEVINWIDQPNTIIDIDDIEEIINQIKNDIKN